MRLIDASVAIDALRGRPPAIELLAELRTAGDALLGSEITRFEILAGVLRREEEATERFLGELVWIPVDEVVARAAGALARTYRPANRGIDDADCIVAATALVYDAPLLTTNVKHFPMFPGLAPPY